jgi:hypothetical protein
VDRAPLPTCSSGPLTRRGPSRSLLACPSRRAGTPPCQLGKAERLVGTRALRRNCSCCCRRRRRRRRTLECFDATAAGLVAGCCAAGECRAKAPCARATCARAVRYAVRYGTRARAVRYGRRRLRVHVLHASLRCGTAGLGGPATEAARSGGDEAHVISAGGGGLRVCGGGDE